MVLLESFVNHQEHFFGDSRIEVFRRYSSFVTTIGIVDFSRPLSEDVGCCVRSCNTYGAIFLCDFV